MRRVTCSFAVLVLVHMLFPFPYRLSTALLSKTRTISSFQQRLNHQRISITAAASTTTTTSSSSKACLQLPNNNNSAHNEQQQQQLHLLIETPDDMHDLGALLSQIATKRGDVLLLDGDLGAGKTCLSRGFVQTMVGQHERVTSPTYLLCNSYPIVDASKFDTDKEDDEGDDDQESPRIIHHMDLYRLSGQEKDLMPLNSEHVFATDICLIEWPQRLGNMVPLHRLEIKLRIVVAVGETEEEAEEHQLLQQQSSGSELEDDERQPRQVTLTPFGKDWEGRLDMLRNEGYVDDWIINTK